MFKNILKFTSIMVMLVLLQSCVRSKVTDVKSPCVSGKGGPCDVRQPINTWLINKA